MTMTQTSPCCWGSAPAPSLLGFSRPFVAFLGGSLVSRIGDALYTFALPWMAYELTHSSLVLGTLYATEIVPVLLFGAFAGVYVDRLNRRHLLLCTLYSGVFGYFMAGHELLTLPSPWIGFRGGLIALPYISIPVILTPRLGEVESAEFACHAARVLEAPEDGA
jgi:MFS family permease